MREVKKKNRVSEWWNRTNRNPPSNRLVKVSIYLTSLLTLVTTLLAALTFHQAERIEGMEEVLQSFKADVRFVPNSITVQRDSIKVDGKIQNFGTRAALNVTMELYNLTPDYVDYKS